MASVSVEFSVYSDPRYKLLGKLTRTDCFGAIGRVSALWMYCIERNVTSLSKTIVDAMASKKGYAEAMIQAELADPIEGDDQMVRIRGTQGRIEYLAAARERQKKASEAAKQKRLEKEAESDLGSSLGSNLGSSLDVSEDSSTGPTLESNESPSLESNIGTGMDVRFSNNASSSTSASSSYKKKNVPNETTTLWNYYKEELKNKKNLDSVKSGVKENTICKKLVDEFGLEKSKALVLVYLQDQDPFVVDAAYQIGLLFSQRQKYLARLGKTASTQMFTFVDSTAEVEYA